VSQDAAFQCGAIGKTQILITKLISASESFLSSHAVEPGSGSTLPCYGLDILYANAFDDIRGTELSSGLGVRDEQGLLNFIRRTASTTWHPAGTCKMGNDDYR
jgi:hypothetical protein